MQALQTHRSDERQINAERTLSWHKNGTVSSGRVGSFASLWRQMCLGVRTKRTCNSFERRLLRAGSALYPTVTVKLGGGKWDLESPSAHSYPSSIALDWLWRILERSEGGRSGGFVQLVSLDPQSDVWEVRKSGMDRQNWTEVNSHQGQDTLAPFADCVRLFWRSWLTVHLWWRSIRQIVPRCFPLVREEKMKNCTVWPHTNVEPRHLD